METIDPYCKSPDLDYSQEAKLTMDITNAIWSAYKVYIIQLDDVTASPAEAKVACQRMEKLTNKLMDELRAMPSSLKLHYDSFVNQNNMSSQKRLNLICILSEYNNALGVAWQEVDKQSGKKGPESAALAKSQLVSTLQELFENNVTNKTANERRGFVVDVLEVLNIPVPGKLLNPT